MKRALTGSTMRSHLEYISFTEGQKSSVFILSPVPHIGQGLPLVKGAIHWHFQICARLIVADRFTKHPMLRWQKILKGLVFPGTERERSLVSAQDC